MPVLKIELIVGVFQRLNGWTHWKMGPFGEEQAADPDFQRRAEAVASNHFKQRCPVLQEFSGRDAWRGALIIKLPTCTKVAERSRLIEKLEAALGMAAAT